MTWTKAYQKRHAKARQRRRRTVQERLEWDRRQAQRAAEALQHALEDLRYGAVTLIVVSDPKEEQFYVMCLETAISGPRLIWAWKRRSWIEYCFRTLKHLLASGACQVQHEDAYYGHLVLRLMGCFVLIRRYAGVEILIKKGRESP